MNRHCSKRPRKSYFEGWYLKHQNGRQTIAFIPSFHAGRDGRPYASLQVITDTGSWQKRFEEADIYGNQKEFYARMGRCVFTEHGCTLQLDEKGLKLEGRLAYGALTPLKSDIMGPFGFLPKLECRHRVYSMLHRVNGAVSLNGTEYRFQNGIGYMEGDMGTSFPTGYLWTQYNSDRISIMIAAASVPVWKWSFAGCLAVIWHKGKEYRMATYLGARIVCAEEKRVVIQQGNLILKAELLSGQSHPLLAPNQGDMNEWIRENASCTVRYQWKRGEEMLFDFVSRHASFESK